MNVYEKYMGSPLPWIEQIPAHWRLIRGKNLYEKMQRLVREQDDVVTCFRDGTVTLRKKRRTTGFTESLKEIGYQGIRKGDLVIHVMDAFAGAIGVSDSNGKGTPVYNVCKAKKNINNQYYALCFVKWLALVLSNPCIVEYVNALQIFVLKYSHPSFTQFLHVTNRIRLCVSWTGRCQVLIN